MKHQLGWSVIAVVSMLSGTSCRTVSDADAQLQVAPANQASQDGPRETVMTKGGKVIFKSSLGNLEIQAGAGYQRTYVWDDGQCSRSVELWPRSERWLGSYGIYYPGPGDHWQECKGITRGVVEEGQMHFESPHAAAEWIKTMQNRCAPSPERPCAMAYNKDGVFVQWSKTLSRKQLSVSVFLIDIKGQKPAALNGATSSVELQP